MMLPQLQALRRFAAAHPLAAVFATALAVRLLWLLVFHDAATVEDAASYLRMGKDLAATGAYLLEGRPSAYWPVGYPFFISLFARLFDDPVPWIKLAQCLLSAATCALIADLARRASPKASLLPVYVLALFPTGISLANLLFSETLFAFLAVLAFRAAASASEPLRLASGLALAGALYVRPAAVVFIPLVFLPDLLGRRFGAYALRTAGVFLLMAACALPWALRNQRLFGSASLSTNLGVNLLIGNHEAATGRYRWTPELESKCPPSANEAECSRIYAREAVTFMRSHEEEVHRLLLAKAALLLFHDMECVMASFRKAAEGAEEDEAPPFGAGAKAAGLLAEGARFAVVLWLLWVIFRRGGGLHPLGWAAFIAFGAQLAFYLPFFQADRYAYPAIPFALLAISLGGPGPRRDPSAQP